METYMAATQVVKEAKFKVKALAILQKQWEHSFTVAIKAMACFKALQDAAKKVKEAF